VCFCIWELVTDWVVRGSNPGGGEIFRTCLDRPWGPPSLLYNGYRVFPGCKERPGFDADPSPPSSAVGHERVELYLYSPYGLYRASVAVQGCTLPLPVPFYLYVGRHYHNVKVVIYIFFENVANFQYWQRTR
jgi:hypothetical protein